MSKISDLNDSFRTTGIGGRIVMTRGVAALPTSIQTKVLETVRDFTAFTEDNDPYGEHDCAFFDVNGERLMFKIDYYDKNLEMGSDDPSDPSVTTRVLTILLANEY